MKPIAAVLLLSGFSIALGAQAAERKLVVGLSAQANNANERALERVLDNPSTRDLQVVRLDPASVATDTTQLQLNLEGRQFKANRVRAERAASGNLVWSGSLDGAKRTASGIDPLNSATLVRSGEGVTGSVRVDGVLYRIRPLPNGDHAIIQVDDSAMPADHPEDAYRALLEKAVDAQAAARDKPCRTNCGGTPVDPGPTATIRVMVVATNDAIAAYGGDMLALTELAVAESNQGYVNSNVGINMVLASYSTTTYATAGMSTDLSRFRGTNDGYMDAIHATRNTSTADVGVLVSNDASACGLASGIGSTAATAFATAYWDCITGYYSFAHEIGHLQSARHDPATDRSTTPYAYGHGYRSPSNTWRTVMAYNCSGSGCPRINYWSNPAVLYGGVPMGTYDVSHNQRVLVQTKAAIAGFR
jgi:peptidyl-Asp metalloendopeptidase